MSEEMTDRERLFTEHVYPLLSKAFDIAVKLEMPLVWTTCYERIGDESSIATSANINGEKAPAVFHAIGRLLELPNTDQETVH